MFNFSYKTRGNSSPQGKPRVYFICHPNDFEGNFEKICEDIFKTQDCVIYYTEDMTEEIPEENREIDLDRMNLFVMPISFRLLHEPNRAMDSDFVFADEKHIPILPIMIDSGIDKFYEEKFGKRQYLNPNSHDLSEISYEEKLQKYLSSVLFDDKTAERVRNAFDAYIFLSYRKKDRAYANQLMRLIHSDPICRDIAIWYDEFLVPGENFSDSIEKMLDKSDLFTLLVTPNLVNEENYVKNVEYPMATEAGKSILPAEMVETDREKLKESYKGIPTPVKPEEEAELRRALVEAFSAYALRENDSDPEHNFLIGLAYLDGIDVEVNREKALELITSAAEAELPEAMKKLFNMYYKGEKVALDWNKSLYWCEKLYNYYLSKNGEKDEDTLTWMNNFAYLCGQVGNYSKALELDEKCYRLHCEVLGEKHPGTLTSLDNLANAYVHLGNYEKAFELHKKSYGLHCEVFGKKHTNTLLSLNNFAVSSGKFGNFGESLELTKKCYELTREVLGEKHPNTLLSLNNLAYLYRERGNREKALELNEKCYRLHCDVFGEKHPDTLISLGNLALAYGELGNYEKVLELTEKCYTLSLEVLGEKHPDTLTFLNSLAYAYGKTGNKEKEIELYERCYALRCKVLGEKHPDTLTSLSFLAITYGELGNHEKELELVEKCYVLRREVFGEKYPDTLAYLNILASLYGYLENHEKALELNEKCYVLRCEVLGEKHPDTLTSLNSLAYAYGKLGNHKKALELHEKVYALRCEVLGETHKMTLKSLDKISELRELMKK